MKGDGGNEIIGVFRVRNVQKRISLCGKSSFPGVPSKNVEL